MRHQTQLRITNSLLIMNNTNKKGKNKAVICNNNSNQTNNTNNNEHLKNLNILTGNYINIGTHNVRGFTEQFKQDEMFREYERLNIDIIGITETKLNEKQSKTTQKNQKIIKLGGLD